MLRDEQIRAENLIRLASDENYRLTSYDLGIGKIIKPGGDIVDEYKIPPQGIVEVIAEERLALPKNISGLAIVKTGLSNKGLLALNIGIIDPGYNGPISSFLVNFSKDPILITKGEIFIRTQFFYNGSEDKSLGEEVKIESYMKEKRARVVSHFSETFLNVDEVLDKAARKYALSALAFVAGVAVIITFAAFLTNFGFFRIAVDTDQRRAEYVVNDARAIEELRAEVRALQQKVDERSNGK
jgi:deoxycytidine triphosphate deaminase